MSFPTLVYKCPGVHFGPNSSTYDYSPAADEAELASLCAQGWHKTLAEAVDPGAKAVREEDGPATRGELESKATELGIKFDGRTTDAGLLKKIDAALGGE